MKRLFKNLSSQFHQIQFGQNFVRLCRIWLVIGMVFSAAFPNRQVSAQDNEPLTKVKALLSKMTPEEKVGQLFLVTFNGVDVSEESQIYDLVVNKHVGGVILQADHDNFTDNTLNDAHDLISQLQTVNWDGAAKAPKGNYIPLIVGLSQEGDGTPNDQILSGLTPLPSEMMIGATWNTERAREVGAALGSDLIQMGVNLLIGPSLDVLESPGIEGGDDLGVRSFGGDPYWVGVMGQAYISGIHNGSNQRLMVISKHFPGRGAADRPLDSEVATVRKSLEQLKQIELAPFIAVTNGSDPAAITDGLMVSHLRYQGFQGNVRATTKPVSLDSTALSQILALEEFSAWREAGGILMSDNLGSLAIRRFSNSTLQSFDSLSVARAAFLAGNDLLYVDNFAGTGDPDSYTGVVNALAFFVQKYNQDAAFAERVDQSVLRILSMKYTTYPNFILSLVLPSASGLTKIGSENGLDFTIAQDAATLIDPSPAELASILPDPPTRTDRIVFLMDSLQEKQCSTCEVTTTPSVDSLQNAVLSSYGPSSGNQVSSNRLSSYSFEDVLNWLNGNTAPENLEYDIRQANWIVFGSLNLDQNRPASFALKRMLSEKQDLLRNKNVIAFSFNAPFYLDATDISKLTAYFGIYGKSQASVNVAALILFQELSPYGASPVSIKGVGYDLVQATTPDPSQVIQLMLDLPVDSLPTPPPALDLLTTPDLLPKFSIGDTLPIRTGVIIDQNGHPVPDGTVARFIITGGSDITASQQVEATTVNGIARTSFRISTKGLLQMRVVSDPAENSSVLQLDVPSDAGGVVVAVIPTEIPTEAPEPTITESVLPSPTAVVPDDDQGTSLTFWTWMLSILIIGLGSGLVYILGLRMHSIRWGIRWAFCAVIGGLTSYIYLVSGLPGGSSWLKLTGTTGLISIVFLFMAFGWAVGILWHSFAGREHPTY